VQFKTTPKKIGDLPVDHKIAVLAAAIPEIDQMQSILQKAAEVNEGPVHELFEAVMRVKSSSVLPKSARSKTVCEAAFAMLIVEVGGKALLHQVPSCICKTTGALVMSRLNVYETQGEADRVTSIRHITTSEVAIVESFYVISKECTMKSCESHENCAFVLDKSEKKLEEFFTAPCGPHRHTSYRKTKFLKDLFLRAEAGLQQPPSDIVPVKDDDGDDGESQPHECKKRKANVLAALEALKDSKPEMEGRIVMKLPAGSPAKTTAAMATSPSPLCVRRCLSREAASAAEGAVVEAQAVQGEGFAAK